MTAYAPPATDTTRAPLRVPSTGILTRPGRTPAHASVPVDRDERGHRRDVQGLRGLAVLLVVAFHAGLGVTGGFIGVDVFFVVSGFVITLGLVAQLDATGTVSLRDFYTRRARRLLPIFAFVSVVTVLGSLFVLQGDIARHAMANTARAASLLTANLQLRDQAGGYFGAGAELNPFLHTWSLSVEEQFYLVLPTLLLLTWKVGDRLGASRRALEATVVVVTAASYVAATAAVIRGGDAARSAFYAMPLRAWEFGLGVVLALSLDRLATLRHRGTLLLGTVGLAAIVASGLLLDSTTAFPGPTALPATLGTAMVIAAGAAPTVVTRALSTGPLTWIGDRSYGWYLWHWPAIVAARVLWPDAGWTLPLAALAALAVTAVTYPLVEQALRYRRALTGIAAVALVGVLVNVPVATASIVARDSRTEIGAVDATFGSAFTVAWQHKCGELPWREDACTFPLAGQAGEVLLVGDSHATALADVVTAAAAEVHRGTVVSTMFGCPAIPRGVLDGGEHGGDSCRRYQEHVLQLIDRLDPDVVVLAERSPYYVRAPIGPGRPVEDVDGTPATSEADALRIWTAGLNEFLDRVHRPVLVVSTIPTFPEQLRTAIAAGRADDASATVSFADVEHRRGDVLAAEAAVTANRSDVVTVDPLPLLCPSDPCRAREGDRWRYHDDQHLKAPDSAVLGEPIARGLLRLLGGG